MKLPDFVQIEPVGQCILGCRMCPQFRSRLASDDPPDICKGCAVYQGHF